MDESSDDDDEIPRLAPTSHPAQLKIKRSIGWKLYPPPMAEYFMYMTLLDPRGTTVKTFEPNETIIVGAQPEGDTTLQFVHDRHDRIGK